LNSSLWGLKKHLRAGFHFPNGISLPKRDFTSQTGILLRKPGFYFANIEKVMKLNILKDKKLLKHNVVKANKVC